MVPQGIWMQEGLGPPESDFQACWVVSVSSMKKEREMVMMRSSPVFKVASLMESNVPFILLTKEPMGMVTMPRGAQRSLKEPSAAVAQ